jgi:hypothetical protein
MDGYAVDSGSFQEVRQAWRELVADLEQDRLAAERLAGRMAPRPEAAGGAVATSRDRSGQALLNSITQMHAFAASFLHNLEAWQGDASTASGDRRFA